MNAGPMSYHDMNTIPAPGTLVVVNFRTWTPAIMIRVSLEGRRRWAIYTILAPTGFMNAYDIDCFPCLEDCSGL